MSTTEWSVNENDIDPNTKSFRVSGIPDLTKGNDCCYAIHAPTDFFCTRRPGHTGRHMAGGGFYGVLAVWA